METLSKENLSEILSHLSGADLLNLCAINKQLSTFCDESNTYFWQKKVLRDYNNIPPKSTNISWKRFYIELGTSHNYIKPVPIKYIGKEKRVIDLGRIWINNTDNSNKLLENANKLFKSRFPHDNPNGLRAVAHIDLPIPEGIYVMGARNTFRGGGDYRISKTIIHWHNPLQSTVQHDKNFYAAITELNYYTTVSPDISENMIPVE